MICLFLDGAESNNNLEVSYKNCWYVHTHYYYYYYYYYYSFSLFLVLLLLLGVIDTLFIKEAWQVVKLRKRSVAIVFGLEVCEWVWPHF